MDKEPELVEERRLPPVLLFLGRAVVPLALPLLAGVLAVCLPATAPNSDRSRIWVADRPSSLPARVIQLHSDKYPVAGKIKFLMEPLVFSSDADPGTPLKRAGVDAAWATLDQLPLLEAAEFKAVLLLGSSKGLDYLATNTSIPDEDLKNKKIAYPKYGPGPWFLKRYLGKEHAWPGLWQPVDNLSTAQNFAALGFDGAVLWTGSAPTTSGREDPIVVTEVLVVGPQLLSRGQGVLLEFIRGWFEVTKMGLPPSNDVLLQGLPGYKGTESKSDLKLAIRKDVETFTLAGLETNRRFFEPGTNENISASHIYNDARNFWQNKRGIPLNGTSFGDATDARFVRTLVSKQVEYRCDKEPDLEIVQLPHLPVVYFEDGADIPREKAKDDFIKDLDEYLMHRRNDTANAHLCIEGYADETGGEPRNNDLSKSRAKWVRNTIPETERWRLVSPDRYFGSQKTRNGETDKEKLEMHRRAVVYLATPKPSP